MKSGPDFYRVLAEPDAAGRWFFGSPIDSSGREIDPRTFTRGVPVSAPPRLSLPLRRQGRPVDFNFCDFDMIVTPAALNVRLGALVGAAIQRIPVAVEGTAGVFEILNVCAQVRCIDEARSAATQWTSADGRPDKTGEFRMITKLRISAGAARGHQIFRAAGWPVALIVSGQVKALLESEAISGVRFERVD